MILMGVGRWDAIATRLLEQLLKKVQWVQNTIRFYGKESLVPRLEAWYGDPGKCYAYSGIRMDPNPWIANPRL
mgnify:CR=1 FL=1